MTQKKRSGETNNCYSKMSVKLVNTVKGFVKGRFESVTFTIDAGILCLLLNGSRFLIPPLMIARFFFNTAGDCVCVYCIA